jgi:hypothetical protein
MYSISIGLVQPNKVFYQSHTSCEYQDPKEVGLGLDKFIDFRWKLKCKENPELFELDCIHGENCQRINNCNCTRIETCNLNDRNRDEEWRYANKYLRRNIRRRIGFKQTQAEQQPQQQQPDNHAKSYSNFESFAEEYFRQ